MDESLDLKKNNVPFSVRTKNSESTHFAYLYDSRYSARRNYAPANLMLYSQAAYFNQLPYQSFFNSQSLNYFSNENNLENSYLTKSLPNFNSPIKNVQNEYPLKLPNTKLKKTMSILKLPSLDKSKHNSMTYGNNENLFEESIDDFESSSSQIVSMWKKTVQFAEPLEHVLKIKDRNKPKIRPRIKHDTKFDNKKEIKRKTLVISVKPVVYDPKNNQINNKK
ncbi:unnamed protein product [Brachionus calyciflorus]|uniref:Uncharacterized protein n=1 Tax=Brachionus calyciflorus TaxID=104777 RepID=A0A814ABR8_9BILA|nr:unnamed protein product [Brachionus calyciflorus]